MYKPDFLINTDAGKAGLIRRSSSLLAGSAALLFLFNAAAFAEGGQPGPDPINGVCVIKTQKVYNKETGVFDDSFYWGTSTTGENQSGDQTCQSKKLPDLRFLDKLSNSGAGDGEISNTIKDLENKVNEKNKEQDDRLDAGEAKDKEQDGRLDGHDKDIGDLKDKDKEQDNRLDSGDVKDKEQDGRLDGHDKDIDRLDRLSVKYVADENGNPTNHVILSGDGTGSPVRLSNVDRGRVDSDAVNVSQLKDTVGLLGGGASVNGDGSITGPTYNIGANSYHTVGDAFTATNDRIDMLSCDTAYQISRLDGRISDVKSEARSGIAGANAFAALRYNDSPGAASLAMAFGGFKSHRAMAIGAGYTTSDGVFRVNAALNRPFNTGDMGWNAGMSWTFN
ncbi:YadA-like family protein [uncultured Bartonella sp.]|uniref:YadA-like family protein n=1 Tax=uncultured Bartonella sp. TaxID=104108 RepID=UPI002617E9E9|nr:YadA-like family protein [uncultured Bartonella sp.]